MSLMSFVDFLKSYYTDNLDRLNLKHKNLFDFDARKLKKSYDYYLKNKIEMDSNSPRCRYRLHFHQSYLRYLCVMTMTN